MRKGLHPFILGAIGFLILAPSISAQSIKQYSVIDLGIVGSASDSSGGSALNNSGQVVGKSSGGDPAYFFASYAFEYSDGIIADLGSLGDPDYVDPDATATDINESGQVVGFAAISAYYYHAFLYSGATMFDLGAVGLLDGHESLAYGINSSGEVVGYYGDNLNLNIGAFLYSGGVVQDIGSFGGDRTWAFDINDSGQIVGFSNTSDGHSHAFLYQNGTMLDLGASGLLAGHDSLAQGINNAGEVVGEYMASDGYEHVFLYSGGTILDLSTLGPLSGNTSYANAINISGEVVGYYLTNDNVPHAFFYAGGSVYNLDDLIAPGSGWTLLSATDINDAGQVTGSGFHNGKTRAFLATPGDITIPPAPNLLNISTRLQVLDGDNVLIGGFIITGSDAKKVLLRGLGPSLASVGVTDYLPDPYLELHDQTGTIAIDEDWKDAQESEIEASGIAPGDDKEAAIVATLSPGAYTVILRQTNGGTGIGLVEAYDLDQAADSTLANISTRGFVDTGDDVMIGGFISGNSLNGGGTILVRVIGPSLANLGVSSALQDPILELHDSNGTVLEANDNWMDTQASEIMATGLAPTDERESAVLMTLAGSAYTAIVRGVNNTTGLALVEVYNLQ